MARLIAAYAPYDGSFEMRIPGLHASRFSRINMECFHSLRLPSLCIVAQGAKTVIVGQDVYEYDASRMIVFSVALPVASQITQASQSEPYLALKWTSTRTRLPNWSEGVSERSASRTGEEARFTSLHPMGHCRRRHQVNGMSSAARGR